MRRYVLVILIALALTAGLSSNSWAPPATPTVKWRDHGNYLAPLPNSQGIAVGGTGESAPAYITSQGALAVSSISLQGQTAIIDFTGGNLSIVAGVLTASGGTGSLPSCAVDNQFARYDTGTSTWLCYSFEVDDYLTFGSGTSFNDTTNTITASGGVSTHASLSGLSADDHPQYYQSDDTAIFTDLKVKGPWVDVRAYGAVGDGATDDGAAFDAAAEAALAIGGMVLVPPSANSYVISTGVNLTLTDNISFVGVGRPKLTLDGGSIVAASATVATLTLNASASRGAVSFTVSNALATTVGDIVFIDTNVDAETGWNYDKLDVHIVSAVSSSLVTIASPLNFSYTTTDTGLAIIVYRPKSFSFSGFDIDIEGTEKVQIIGTKGSTFSNLNIVELDRNKGADPIHVQTSVDTELHHISFDGVRYGVNVSTGSRETFISDIYAQFSHHPVSPNTFSDGVYVDRLAGYKNNATMDSHPAFNVHYRKVKATQDTDWSNLRSVGGSVVDSEIESTSNSDSAYFQNVALADLTIYEDYEFYMENVIWSAPNANDISQGINVSYGDRITLRNVVVPFIFQGVTGDGAPREVIVDGCETGYIRARPDVRLVISDTMIDGDLNPDTSVDHLVSIANVGDVVINNSTLRDQSYAIANDSSTNISRFIVNSHIDNISSQFDTAFNYTDYKYHFVNVDFDTVAAFGASIFQDKTRVISSSFSGGASLDQRADVDFARFLSQPAEASTIEGTVAYANSTGWNPSIITRGDGLHVYSDTAWEAILQSGDIGVDVQSYNANADTDSTDDYTQGGTDVTVADGGTGKSSWAVTYGIVHAAGVGTLTQASAPANSQQYLQANATLTGYRWATPSGSGDMAKATYDTDADDDIDLAAGGTNASLVDPNDNQVMGWDDTQGAVVFQDMGTGLAYNDTTNTWSASGSGSSLWSTTTGNAAYLPTYAGADLATAASPMTAYLDTLYLQFTDSDNYAIAYATASGNRTIVLKGNEGAGDGYAQVSVVGDATTPYVRIEAKDGASQHYADFTESAIILGTGVAQAMRPLIGDVYNLGNSGNPFEDAYIDDLFIETIDAQGTEIQIKDDLVPDVDSAYTVGSASFAYSYGYFDNIVMPGFTATAGLHVAYNVTTGAFYADDDDTGGGATYWTRSGSAVWPTNAGDSLGTATTAVGDVYADLLTADQTLTALSTVVMSAVCATNSWAIVQGANGLECVELTGGAEVNNLDTTISGGFASGDIIYGDGADSAIYTALNFSLVAGSVTDAQVPDDITIAAAGITGEIQSNQAQDADFVFESELTAHAGSPSVHHAPVTAGVNVTVSGQQVGVLYEMAGPAIGNTFSNAFVLDEAVYEGTANGYSLVAHANTPLSNYNYYGVFEQFKAANGGAFNIEVWENIDQSGDQIFIYGYANGTQPYIAIDVQDGVTQGGLRVLATHTVMEGPIVAETSSDSIGTGAGGGAIPYGYFDTLTATTVVSDSVDGVDVSAHAADQYAHWSTSEIENAVSHDNLVDFVTTEHLTPATLAGFGLVDNATAIDVKYQAPLTANGDTLAVANADSATQGAVEIATITETNTGTSNTLAVSPDGLDGWTGSGQVTTLGAIGTGVWSATALTDARVSDTITVGAGGSVDDAALPASATFNAVIATTATVNTSLTMPDADVYDNLDGTGLTYDATNDELDVDATIYTDSWSAQWLTPAAADDDIILARAKGTGTITAIDCWTTGGTSTVLVVQNGGSNVTDAGGITCTAGAWVQDTTLANTTLADGNKVAINTSAVNGTPSKVFLQVTYTEP